MTSILWHQTLLGAVLVFNIRHLLPGLPKFNWHQVYQCLTSTSDTGSTMIYQWSSTSGTDGLPDTSSRSTSNPHQTPGLLSTVVWCELDVRQAADTMSTISVRHQSLILIQGQGLVPMMFNIRHQTPGWHQTWSTHWASLAESWWVMEVPWHRYGDGDSLFGVQQQQQQNIFNVTLPIDLFWTCAGMEWGDVALVTASFDGTSPCHWGGIHLWEWTMTMIRTRRSHEFDGEQSTTRVSIVVVELILLTAAPVAGWWCSTTLGLVGWHHVLGKTQSPGGQAHTPPGLPSTSGVWHQTPLVVSLLVTGVRIWVLDIRDQCLLVFQHQTLDLLVYWCCSNINSDSRCLSHNTQQESSHSSSQAQSKSFCICSTCFYCSKAITASCIFTTTNDIKPVAEDTSSTRHLGW